MHLAHFNIILLLMPLVSGHEVYPTSGHEIYPSSFSILSHYCENFSLIFFLMHLNIVGVSGKGAMYCPSAPTAEKPVVILS